MTSRSNASRRGPAARTAGEFLAGVADVPGLLDDVDP
jgi:hypothetical protein